MSIRTAIAVLILAAVTTSAASQTRPSTSAAQAPRVSATISGVVLAEESKTPVRLARVTLNSVDRGGAANTATTDADGRFVFRGVPAGRYVIQSSKRAWLDANYGASRLGRPGTPVAVRDGEQLTGLAIRMTRGAVITGVVRDPNGELQPGVQVRVLRFVTRDGLRSLERPVSANMNDPITDDEGAYRVFGLPPGDYLVVAALRLGSDSSGLGGDEIRLLAPGDVDRALASASRIGSSPDAGAPAPTVRGSTVTNAPVYFPGTTDLSAAATITLVPGEERGGVDIRFALFPTARVSGTVAVLPVGATLPGETDRPPECRMTPAGFEDLMAKPIAAAVTRLDSAGRLMFPGVPPGRYTVVCVHGRPGGSGGPQLLGWAETSLVVDGQDLEFAMAFGPAATLFGRVVFEGSAPPKDPSAEQLRIRIRPLGKARLLRDFDTGPQADGTFKFAAMIPGGWALAFDLPRLSPWTVKSLTMAGQEMPDNLIQVAGSDPLGELVVTFTDRSSELAGALQDAAGRPAAEYFVIAFSTDRSTWTPSSRRIQSARPASDGAFSIKGLPAGEYYLAALTDVEPGEWLSPAFLDQIVGASVRVRITDGEKTLQSMRIAR